jgi:hypothetical protein
MGVLAVETVVVMEEAAMGEAMEVVEMEVGARVVAVRGAQKLEPRRAPRT